MKKRKKRLVLIAVAALIAAVSLISSIFLFANHSTTTTLPSITTTLPSGGAVATYITSSAPNSSQWLIVKSLTRPSSVAANNTGTIPEYSTLAALNETKIGVYCDSVSSSGECLVFKTYLETGWYWDSSNQLLYVHYVGDAYVNLSIYA